jgi:hypothetical protein
MDILEAISNIMELKEFFVFETSKNRLSTVSDSGEEKLNLGRLIFLIQLNFPGS